MLDSGMFDHERFGEVFGESDRFLVDAALRIVRRSAPDLDVSAECYAALLLVAKAINHNHAAIDLDEPRFTELVEELWVVRTRAEERFVGSNEDPAQLRSALLSADRRLVDHLAVEESRMRPDGSPFVVSTIGGRPRFISTRRLVAAEARIAVAMLDAAATTDMIDSIPTIDDVLAVKALNASEASYPAFFANALERKISILTGGPGTGKTTAIAALLERLGRAVERSGGRPVKVALCAPTAKAAVRMRESIDQRLGGAGLSDFADHIDIDRRSGSIHRILGIRPDSTRSQRVLESDLLIVDEVSMLELPLFPSLIRAARDGHVVLVGDPDQLRSVEVGAVLADLTAAASGNAAPLSGITTTLTVNHRSAGAIGALAKAINAGDVAAASKAIETSAGAIRIAASPSAVRKRVVDHAARLRASAIAGDEERSLADLRDLVVLAANREGEQSVAWWQRTIKQRLDSDEPWEDIGRRFAVGMPVMITKNENSPLRQQAELLANGDVGVVVNGDEGPVVVFLPLESRRTRQLRFLDQAEMAWAFTIHKSQGSEYEEVVVSLPKDSKSRILSRELLYTAVTRASKRVVLVGPEEVFVAAIERTVDRVSGLTPRLVALAAED